MNKRKIILLATALSMIAILAVGGTLAYFTSEEAADNVFTMGYIEIDLNEDFEVDEETGKGKLVPGLDVNKDVWIENTGDMDAYVRVHIAIPSVMDDGDPSFAAVNNFLHFNFENASVQDGLWSWLPEYTTGVGYKGNGAGNWNFYTDTIDEMEYNIYVVTYRSALAPAAKTENALDKVYLDATVDAVANRNDAGEVISTTYTDTKGNEVTLTPVEAQNIHVLVWAEGTQTETFENAYDALNTAFGTPGSEGYVSPWNK